MFTLDIKDVKYRVLTCNEVLLYRCIYCLLSLYLESLVYTVSQIINDRPPTINGIYQIATTVGKSTSNHQKHAHYPVTFVCLKSFTYIYCGIKLCGFL